MRTLVAGILLVMIGPTLETLATDVAYQLETKQLASAEEPQLVRPPALEIKDRTWVAPGPEEAIGTDLENSHMGFTFRKFRSAVCIVADPPAAGEEFWPRTRELWGGYYYQGLRIEHSPNAYNRW